MRIPRAAAARRLRAQVGARRAEGCGSVGGVRARHAATPTAACRRPAAASSDGSAPLAVANHRALFLSRVPICFRACPWPSSIASLRLHPFQRLPLLPRLPLDRPLRLRLRLRAPDLDMLPPKQYEK